MSLFPMNHSTSFLPDEEQVISKNHLNSLKYANDHSINTELFLPNNFQNYILYCKNIFAYLSCNILFLKKIKHHLLVIIPFRFLYIIIT